MRKDYSLHELKADLAVLYLKAGLKSIGITFLMSDAQVADEKFLIAVNDMLASGEITELFPDDQVDNIVNAVRNEVDEYSGEKYSAYHRNAVIAIVTRVVGQANGNNGHQGELLEILHRTRAKSIEMRPVFLAGRGDPAKKGQAVPRDSKLHGDRLVSGLAAEGPGIRIGKVSRGTYNTFSWHFITLICWL